MRGWDLGAFLRAAVALGISSFLKFSGDVRPGTAPEIEKKKMQILLLLDFWFFN